MYTSTRCTHLMLKLICVRCVGMLAIQPADCETIKQGYTVLIVTGQYGDWDWWGRTERARWGRGWCDSLQTAKPSSINIKYIKCIPILFYYNHTLLSCNVQKHLCHLTTFQVQGVKGTYISNMYTKGGNPVTKITFDQGREWKQIPAPVNNTAGKPLTCHLVCHTLY